MFQPDLDLRGFAFDLAPSVAAGTIYIAPSGNVLLLKRSQSEKNFGNHWSLPGGKAEEGESAEDAAAREAKEELGGTAPEGKRRALSTRTTPTGMTFHTFLQRVPEEFVPRLIDGEHTEYVWASPKSLPAPMHPAVADTFESTDTLWEPAQDAALAFDRDSVRTIDRDGRMHVATTNISKANVCPYVGREIPDWEGLGLEPEKVYQLLRDPDELERAASTFNNVPLLSKHVAVTSDDHQPELVIGSTGTDSEFAAPYLRNSLVIWARSAIAGIQNGAKRELSSAYRYRADMTPGTFEGVEYDGVMRDLVANHVALVEEGRAGADVVVGDSTEVLMSSKPVILTRKATLLLGALIPFLKPKLAQDAKINFYPVLSDVTAKNFKEKRPKIVAALKEQTKGQLAKDASLDDVEKVLDMLDGHEINESGTKDAAEIDPNTGAPMAAPKAMDDPTSGLRDYLTNKGMSADDVEAACATMKPKAMDAEETDEEKKKREEKEKAAKDADNPFAKKDDDEKKDDKKDEGAKDMVTKDQMSAAVKAAVTLATDKANQTQREIRDAEKAVRPYIGDLAMAHDSAEAVYRTALTSLGQDSAELKDLPLPALKAILKVMPLPGAKKTVAVAMDSAGEKSFAEMYPDASRIQIR